MRAVLLVGGLATRLRPLSLRRPKALFPVAGRPIIDYLLEGLSRAGCRTAVLAVNYLADALEECLGGERFGVELVYSREEEPLGTGGPIKLASELVGDEDFLVLNGDILSLIDYTALMEAHRHMGGLATIVLKEVEDPSRFGVVRMKGDRIVEFVEKPRGEAPSSLVNAGCYALSPEVLGLIPEGKVSLEREVFPVLAQRGELRGYQYEGIWLDIGLPRDYLAANKLMLGSEKLSSLEPGCRVEHGARVEGSILWSGTWVGPRAIVVDSVLGKRCRVGEDASIKGAVLGDEVVVERGVEIGVGATVYPGLRVERDVEPGQVVK